MEMNFAITKTILNGAGRYPIKTVETHKEATNYLKSLNVVWSDPYGGIITEKNGERARVSWEKLSKEPVYKIVARQIVDGKLLNVSNGGFEIKDLTYKKALDELYFYNLGDHYHNYFITIGEMRFSY